MTYYQVTYIFSFAFCLFTEKQKEQKNKHTEELHRSGIEPGTSRSPVLHFTTALMHTLKNSCRKSLLKQLGLPKL